MRRVTVYWWKGQEKIQLGELAQANSPQIVFEWDKDFLNDPMELSPVRFIKKPGLIECPKEPFEGLPGLFADHVPDGWGRILLRHRFGKEGLGLAEVSPLDMLSYIGERSMGALSFEPSVRPSESWADGMVDLDALNLGAEQIMSGTPSDVIEQFLEGGASPNGIRPKIIVKEKNGKFYLGKDEPTANEWLIKFRAPSDSSDIGKIEYVYLELARDAGLNVPEAKLIETDKGAFFATKRFDRADMIRLHMHTLSGLLQASPANFSISYEHFAKVATFLTKDIREVEQVFRIATFNVLSSNRDDHSKNVAFLMEPNGRWHVAPAYDLTYFEGQFGQHKMTLNGKGLPDEMDLKTFAKTFGIRAKISSQIIEQTKEALTRFKHLAKKYDVSSFELQRIQKRLSV